MEIKKGDITFKVKENKRTWLLSTEIGAVTANFSIEKTLCRDIKEVERFVLENDIGGENGKD